MPHTKTHWDDTLFPDPVSSPKVSDLDCAMAALDKGDLQHAAFHIACALSDNPASTEALGLFERVIRSTDTPIDLIELEEDAPSFALVAARAYVLAHLGRLTEALDMIFRVQEVHPELDYFAWAERWLGRPDAAAGVSPDGLTAGARRWVVSIRPENSDMLQRGEVVVRKLAVAHPSCASLLVVHSIALRKLGDLDGALATAIRAHEAGPCVATCLAVAMAKRSRGELAESIPIFRDVLRYDPTNAYVLLDIGDIHLELGDVHGALAAYEQSLSLQPHQEWAEPSALYCRYRLERDTVHLKALKALARAPHNNHRAKTLLEELRSMPIAEGATAKRPAKTGAPKKTPSAKAKKR